MTYAEKVWEECYEVALIEDMDGKEEDVIAVISAALKRQREECARAAAKHYVNQPMDYAILNAEVKE